MEQLSKMVEEKILSASNSLPKLNQMQKHSKDIFKHGVPDNAFYTALLRKLLGEKEEEKYG